MLPEARSIINFTLVVFCAGLVTSCALFDPPKKNTVSARTTPQRIYYSNFDQVWRAAHSVIRYTIANENQETGYLETEYIKGSDGWNPPDSEKKPSAGTRYKLFVSFVKGKTEDRDSTRVTIEKRIEVVRDFFAEPEIITSDGLEEKIIFYRLERELIIAEALKKASNTSEF